jgi:hypothetical protein
MGKDKILKRKLPITFVVAINNQSIYQNNLLASPIFTENDRKTIHILERRNFKSAAIAYNSALEETKTDLIVFIHQDVFLPDRWLRDLKFALSVLDRKDPEWGVLGSWGFTEQDDYIGYCYSTGWGIMGKSFRQPTKIQTLDELILITRKSSGLRFDNDLPYYHLYGTDICMRAYSKGMNCYSISAFCVHNTDQIYFLPKEFYKCYKHVKKKWRHFLPIHTPCAKITKYDFWIYRRWFYEILVRLRGEAKRKKNRVENPANIYKELDLLKER